MSWETFWQVMILIAWSSWWASLAIRECKRPYVERKVHDDKGS